MTVNNTKLGCTCTFWSVLIFNVFLFFIEIFCFNSKVFHFSDQNVRKPQTILLLSVQRPFLIKSIRPTKQKKLIKSAKQKIHVNKNSSFLILFLAYSLYYLFSLLKNFYCIHSNFFCSLDMSKL